MRVSMCVQGLKPTTKNPNQTTNTHQQRQWSMGTRNWSPSVWCLPYTEGGLCNGGRNVFDASEVQIRFYFFTWLVIHQYLLFYNSLISVSICTHSLYMCMYLLSNKVYILKTVKHNKSPGDTDAGMDWGGVGGSGFLLKIHPQGTHMLPHLPAT